MNSIRKNTVNFILISYISLFMRSLGKSTSESARSPLKRTNGVSTQRLHKKNTLQNPIIQPVSNSGTRRFQTVRIVGTKQKKMNNYLQVTFKKRELPARPKTTTQLKLAKNGKSSVEDELLLKNSDKTKLIYWNKNPQVMNNEKIILSADFIINQDNFWETNLETSNKIDQKGQEGNKSSQINFNSCLQKQWKILHKCYFVIWLISRKNTLSKLQNLLSIHNLPLHAVFYVKRKKKYTIDLTPIERQIEKEKHQQMHNLTNQNSPLTNNINHSHSQPQGNNYPNSLVYFQLLKINSKETPTYQSYRGKIPIFQDKTIKFYYLHAENQKLGLECVVKFLSKSNKKIKLSEELLTKRIKTAIFRKNDASCELQQLFQSKCYLKKYLEEIQSLRKQKQQKKQTEAEVDWSYDEEQIIEKIDSLKKSLINDTVNAKGRYFQFEGNTSIHYFIGEMIKRNYNVLYEGILHQMDQERKGKLKKA